MGRALKLRRPACGVRATIDGRSRASRQREIANRPMQTLSPRLTGHQVGNPTPERICNVHGIGEFDGGECHHVADDLRCPVRPVARLLTTALPGRKADGLAST